MEMNMGKFSEKLVELLEWMCLGLQTVMQMI